MDPDTNSCVANSDLAGCFKIDRSQNLRNVLSGMLRQIALVQDFV